MGQVGHFGELQFYVKTENGVPRMQSFDGMSWNTSVNVEEHKRQGKKPLLEVTGKNSDEVTMSIYFSAKYGVNPWKKLLKLRRYNLESKVFPLVLGGRRLGSFKWMVTNVSSELTTFYKNGKVTDVRANVTFKEYPYKKGKSKKKRLVSPKKGSSNAKNSSKSTRKKGYEPYVVKKGDTLWALAKKHYGSGSKYTKIYNANKKKTDGFDVIVNANKLSIGMKIKIPV